MALAITGKLHELFETQAVTERFNKREFVVELPGRHPQLVLFQLTGKRSPDNATDQQHHAGHGGALPDRARMNWPE